MAVSESRKNRTITWLHISDIHFQNGDSYDRKVVLRALTSAVQQFRTQDRRPDFIFFTGDIAFGGKEKEYVNASTFFDELLRVAELDKQHLFVVPGNHDVDRDQGQWLARSLVSENESVTYFGPSSPGPHFAKFATFHTWYKNYFQGVREWPQHSTCQTPEVVEVGGLRVGILAINSALFCLGDDDHNKLWIGRRCLDEALETFDQLSPDLRIALVHHPLDWLHDKERSNIKSKLHEKFDVVLRGHLHENETEDVNTPAGSVKHIAAGALYQTREYPNRAFFIRVDFGHRTISELPIRYEDNPREVWTVDPSLFPNEPDYERVSPIEFKTGKETSVLQRTGRLLDSERAIETQSRISRLRELDHESRARCVVRWQETGVSRSEALKLVDDPEVGLPKSEWLPSPEKPIILLIGEIGAGKSLIAERFFQKTIAEARSDAEAPLPMFLEAPQIAGRLQEAVEEATRNLGNPRTQGITLIIEGTGGLETNSAYDLLNEARFLVGAWPKTTVLITSTPTPIFDREEESVKLPRLTEQEIFKLIAKVSGNPVPAYIVIKEGPLAEAVRLPLFAVLMGVFLREYNERTPHSTGELLSSLVERAFGKTKRSRTDAEQLLRQLAVLSTDHGSGPVYAADIASKERLQPLLDSGLVIERSGTLQFSLQLLTFWFAAQSLANAVPTLDDLLQDAQRLDRWQYPLVIFIASSGHDQVSNVLAPLVERHPAFAAKIVNEGLAKWSLVKNGPTLSTTEYGQRVRQVMQSWIKGIGPLAQLIAPVREDGDLRPLGVRSLKGRDFAHFWYYGKEDLREIIDLPPNIPTRDPSDPAYDEWREGVAISLGQQPAWAWRWAFRALTTKLSRLLERHELPMSGGPLAQESLWQEALAVTERNSFYQGFLSLAEVADRLREFSDNTSWQVGGLSIHIGTFRKKLENLRRSGKTDIIAPWPGPDKQTGNFLWERYTPEQELARTKAVFAGALESYQQIVSSWFPKFASRMQTAAILPARMVVIIGRTKDDTPTRSWYFEPLAQEEQSLVDVCFRQEERKESDRDLLKRLESKIRFFRPEMATWFTPRIHHQLATKIFGLTPATALVYGWLEDDLRGIAWIN